MELRKETNVCWAHSAPLTNGHKLQGGTEAPVAERRK